MSSQMELIKERDGIKEFRLTSNGLRILLVPYGIGEAVGFMVHYNVGSRNEAVGYTGSTHFLEHLLFKGSKNFPKDTHSIDDMLSDIGALFNANTWTDRTGYYEVVTPEHLDICMQIEADRMRGATFTEEDRQDEMTVVRNEFERGESSDLSVLHGDVISIAIIQHPYHHRTIGWRTDVEGVSIERIRKFYDDFYWPNNALVIVVSSLPESRVLSMIEQHFGEIPRSRNPIAQVYTEEPKQRGERRVILKRPANNGIIQLAWMVPGLSHEDRAPLEILQFILSEGEEDLLTKNFVDTKMVSSMFLWLYPFRDPHPFFITAKLLGPKGHARIQAKVLRFLNQLQKDGFDEDAIERAKRLAEAYIAYQKDGIAGILNAISFAEGGGTWELYDSYVEYIQKVTLDDVMRVFRQYFIQDNLTIGWFVPEKATGGSQ